MVVGRKEFEASLRIGHHADLARLVGGWSGTVKTWFEADQLAGEGSVRGRIRSALGGRFVIHEYEAQCLGETENGVAIHGYHLDRHCYESAWIDSFHTGTQIMVSHGVPRAALHSVTGSYGGESDDEAWGWRTEIELKPTDRLLIQMFNITPQGEDALAVEFDYRRVRGSRPV